ncbi:MAG: hypothetical protein EBV19_03820 [Flavobacteriia bacterium]|nr:hypothetical protein [Flavobacteriia bacterium]
MESPGVGSVERNTVVSIMIQKQEKNYPQQKTIMMVYVVERKKDLNKKTIAEEAVQVIVRNVGLIKRASSKL